MTKIARRLVVRYQLQFGAPFGFYQCFGDGKMRKPLSILACSLVIGVGAVSSHAWAQAKTAKACTEEWRADKANFQAKGITEKAYVADCRAGTASAPAAAPATAPTAAAPAPRPMAPSPAATNVGQKTAKACVEEWRADKANFQAKGITEKAYVASCRAGTASTPAAAPAPAPTAAAPAPMPTAPAPAAANAGQKTVKACVEEWRADKAGFQAKGITEKAYVASCRAGTASTPAAAPGPAPTAAAPAESPATPAPPAPRPTAAAPTRAPAVPSTRTGSPSAAGQFATEAEAKATCPADTVVWVNLTSKIYHFSGTHNYGTTKNGAYMCEKDTAAQGLRAAKNEQHP
jgi:hypothetical protein